MLKELFKRLLKKKPKTDFDKQIEAWFKVKGDITLRLEYPLCSSSVVLDAGGYEGQWAHDIYDKYECKVFIFEPIIDFYKKIEERFSENPDVTPYPFGLAGETRNETFSLLNDATSSLLANDLKNEGIEAKLVCFKEFVDNQKLNKIDLIKINIEGGEYELLEHILETGIINKIQDIQVQFHSFIPNAEERMKAIQGRLSKTHKRTWSFPFVWENWSRIKDSRES